MIKGELLASIRVDKKSRPPTDEHYHRLAFVDRHGFVWYHVRRAKNALIVCACGGVVKDNEEQNERDPGWGGCSHILTLYDGQLTEDSRNAHIGMLPRFDRSIRWLVRLTPRGARMFKPRWVAKALAP